MDRVDAAGGMVEAVRPDKTLTKPVQGFAAISMRIGTPEVRIGELMRDVPKASGGDRRSENFKNDTAVHFETKQAVIEQAGFTPKQVQRFETLAAHPEAVERAKAEARENDDIEQARQRPAGPGERVFINR